MWEKVATFFVLLSQSHLLNSSFRSTDLKILVPFMDCGEKEFWTHYILKIRPPFPTSVAQEMEPSVTVKQNMYSQNHIPNPWNQIYFFKNWNHRALFQTSNFNVACTASKIL
jgi:hypothetical protein